MRRVEKALLEGIFRGGGGKPYARYRKKYRYFLAVSYQRSFYVDLDPVRILTRIQKNMTVHSTVKMHNNFMLK
jgi:hypothetical protein